MTSQFINDQFKILNETTLFYENLRQNVYRKTENIYTEYFLLRLTNSNVTKLTHDDSNSLEGTLINTEVYNFLKKKMTNYKSPAKMVSLKGFIFFFLKRH